MTKPKRYKRYSAEFKREAILRASEEGNTYKAVCEELGISTRQFLRWRDELRLLGDEAFPGQGRTGPGQEGTGFFKGSGGVLCQAVEVKYACIDRRRNRYPVRMMCGLLSVSRSGYYAWRSRPESPRAKRDRELMSKIRRAHAKSNGVYGSPRVQAELVAAGVRVGRHKVARLMRLERIRGCPKRRFRVTTQRDPRHAVARNLLKRNFSADAANQRWASDITYISTHEGWLYLAVVMDLYSRRIPRVGLCPPKDRLWLVDEPLDEPAHRTVGAADGDRCAATRGRAHPPLRPPSAYRHSNLLCQSVATTD